MLHWLHNIVPKRFLVFSKLCFLVSSTHLVLLSFLFVGFKSRQEYALEIAKQLQITADTKIMFMPLYQTTKGFAHKTGARGNRGGRRSGGAKFARAARTCVTSRAATSLISDVPAIKSKKKGTGFGAKTKKEKNKKSKIALEKEKKLETKKELEKKKKEEPKKEPEKIEAAKELAPEQKQETSEHNAEQAKAEDLGAGLAAGDTAGEKNNQAGQEDIVYVGQQEYDALGMQTYLQQELSTNWQPPQGMPADAACEISFVVDWQGKANTVAVSKSSGALVYDISARSALLAMEFPEWARGKAFKITFKQ